MPQPLLFGSASIAPATPSPFWSKVDRGTLSLSVSTLPPLGPAVSETSVRQKLPLVARPGPFFTSDGSASASIRKEVSLDKSVSRVKVNVSLGGLVPPTRMLPSSFFVNVAPPKYFMDTTSGTTQVGGAGLPACVFSHSANRPGNSFAS